MKRHIAILAFGLVIAAGATFAQIGPSTTSLTSASSPSSVLAAKQSAPVQSSTQSSQTATTPTQTVKTTATKATIVNASVSTTSSGLISPTGSKPSITGSAASGDGEGQDD